MKKFLLAILGAVSVSASAFAFHPRLQIDYVNYAWGFSNHGCLIDVEGNVYTYRYGHASDGKGLVSAGKMTAADLAFANQLIEKAQQGKYSQKMVAADAGTTTWSAQSEYGGEVKLQSRGDVRGENSAPESQDLVKLMNGLCSFETPEFP